MEKFTRKYTGEVDGKTIWDYRLKSSDYNIDNVDERLERVNTLLNIDDDGFTNDKFLRDIWDVDMGVVLNVHPNGTGQLWSESNICSQLETIANYILYADSNDSDKNLGYKKRETIDSMIKSDALQHKEKGVIEKDINGDIMLVIKKDINYKKAIKYKCDENDLKKYPQLKPYFDLEQYCSKLTKTENINLLKNELDKINKNRVKFGLKPFTINEFKAKLNKIKIQVRDDKVMYKLSLERPLRFKVPLKDEGCPSWDEVDFFDEEQIYYLLPLKKEPDNLQDDFYWILKDLDNLIKECTFTEKQWTILECYRNGMSLSVIAKHCGITDSVVQKTIKACVKIIINQYEKKYTDWYYLNICKGKYKKCNRCGEIKLVSEFNKDSKGGMGVKAYCKGCVNNDNI